MLKEVLKPIPQHIVDHPKQNSFGAVTAMHIHELPAWEEADIVLFGVKDGRDNHKNRECSTAPDFIRKALYRLKVQHNGMKLADIGNIDAGESAEDTEAAINEVVSVMLEAGVIPVILGGSMGLSYSIYSALTKYRDNIDISFISPYLQLDEGSLIDRICAFEPNHLFNMSVIGYQSHYTDPREVHTFGKMYFDAQRLGVVKARINEAEPILRNADMISIDIGAVKQADAPGNYYNNPNGFTAEEACQLAWYSGISDKVSAFGTFEINPEFDYRDTTSKLGAQIIWYFVDGFYHRSGDHPNLHNEFLKYRCTLNDRQPDILFYKSKRTDRWWMEIPNLYHPSNRKNVVIPCTYNDYQMATRNEMPDRFFKALQRMPR